MPHILTPRLELIPADVDALRAELAGPRALGLILRRIVPDTWPPELYDRDAILYSLRRLTDDPSEADWGFYYFAQRREIAADGVLVGAGGFKGAPDQGVVEIGYSILAEQRRCGYASEAVEGLVAFAFSVARAERVIAHTLRSLTASIRVLERTGFVCVGAGQDAGAPPGEDVIRYETRARAALTLFSGAAAGSVPRHPRGFSHLPRTFARLLGENFQVLGVQPQLFENHVDACAAFVRLVTGDRHSGIVTFSKTPAPHADARGSTG